jgi:BirA family biotin operon repressor/biotin-[acetyl-CoA-carboxylase] ligase
MFSEARCFFTGGIGINTDDKFTLEILTQALYPRAVRYFERIGSTNDQAQVWLESGGVNGSVVIADEQTRGRGRLGRTWLAPAGTALLFTVLLRPSPRHVTRISMLGALSVVYALRSFGVDRIGIKWPNDVQIDGRKICGVLPEALWDGEMLVGVALGIGVNIRVDFAATPFAQTAISLHQVSSTRVRRIDVLIRVLEHIDQWAGRIGDESFFAAWRSELTTLGQYVTVDGRRWVAEDVDPDGGLLIRDAHGTIQRVIAGDISSG